MTFNERTCDLIHQQVIFQMKQLAHAILQMDFEYLFVRQQLVETSIQTIVLDLISAHTEQIRQRCFRISRLGDIELTGRLKQSREDERCHIPRDRFKTFLWGYHML